ncbi:MAG: alpha-mannosidase [Christensenellales bacterium]
MDFDLLKIEGTLKAIGALSVLESIDLRQRGWARDPSPLRHCPDAFLSACRDLAFQPFDWQDRWGAADESRVFRLDITLPPSFAGGAAWLEITTGREDGYAAFNPQFFGYVDGRLVQGLDINHRLLPLCDEARANQQVQVLLHAYAGTKPGAMTLGTRLLRRHPLGMTLYSAWLTAYQALVLLPQGSGERVEMTLALLKAAGCLDLGQMAISPAARESGFQAALEALEEGVYARGWGLSPVTVFPVGHTHIDVAWQWPVSQTRQKAQRSFATVVQLMAGDPDYRFFSSQPLLYQFVKEDNPTLFLQIKALVRSGRWEAEGGMWLEADCNLPSGESLVRQIYYGKKFLREEFGVDSQLLWMPDSFGYCAVLPQLMAGAGLKYFATSKLSWNEFNRVPNDIFSWLGPDGSGVLACMITTPDDTGLENAPDFSTYNATLQPRNVLGAWQRRGNKALSRKVMMPFGYGDGGGGPTGEMLESARWMDRGLPGLPRLDRSGIRRYFSDLAEDVEAGPLPHFKGELYLEFHRGTYTAVAAVKRDNRRGELMMAAVELMAAASGRDDRFLRETLWKNLALRQFHDVLPGSAIAQVYQESTADHARLLEACGGMLREGALALAAGKERALCLVNPHWRSLPQVLLLEGLEDLAPCLDGQPLMNQLLPDGRRAVYFASLPAFGLQTLALIPASPEVPRGDPARDPLRLENQFFSLRLDRRGEIVSLIDKRLGRQLARPGRALNALLLFEDRPATCDAWNIDINYGEKPWPLGAAEAIEVWEDGPVCSSLRVRRRFRSSGMTQIIRLYHQVARIEFDCEIDWQERQMLLKAAFPLDIQADSARCGTQFGTIDRPMWQNTSWDLARFEICAHRFIDIAEPDYGVALLMGDKYGADLLGGELRLSLLKGPVDPWPEADRGRHRFSYSLYPHLGSALSSDVYVQAAQVDRVAALLCEGLRPGVGLSLAQTETEGVAMEALKPAEDGRGIILRVNEYLGRHCEACIDLPRPALSLHLCDLLENDLAPLPSTGGRIRLPLLPKQIKTLRVVLAADGQQDQMNKEGSGHHVP